MEYKSVNDCKGKKIYVRELIKEMQQSDKSIDDIAKQIEILTHPLCYENSFVIDRDTEYPEDLLKEIFYSFRNTPIMQMKIRKALEKLIIEWQNQDQYSIDQLGIYLNLISSFRIQSTVLYDWLVQNAKKGAFKRIYSRYRHSPLHLMVLNLLFYYVRPSIKTIDMINDEKFIIRRDIKEVEYTHICFRRAWYISLQFAEELFPEYFKTAVIVGDEERSFLFQWEFFLKSMCNGMRFKLIGVKLKNPAMQSTEPSIAKDLHLHVESIPLYSQYSLYLYVLPFPYIGGKWIAFIIREDEGGKGYNIEQLRNINKVKEYLKEYLEGWHKINKCKYGCSEIQNFLEEIKNLPYDFVNDLENISLPHPESVESLDELSKQSKDILGEEFASLAN